MVMNMQIRGLAESSQNEYVRYVQNLQKFYGKPVAEVTENKIKTFLHHLIAKKKPPASDVRNALNSIYNRINSKGIAIFDIRNYDDMLSQKPKFLPMRINEEKDGKIVSVLYVFDYLERTIQFNVVYLIFDKASGERKMEVECVENNPIGKDLFLRLLNETGFKEVSVKDTGTNYIFTAIRD